MTEFTRRDVLGSTVGAATLLAGCSESSSSGSFSKTAVEDQQLVVEFEKSLDAETISVVDPDGESFAETEVSAGVSRVTFDIAMPYTPGEYVILAAGGDETVAETTQEIRPELEIIDVGVGANRMDEMPEELHFAERQVVISVENSGTGPEGVKRLSFSAEFPNSNAEREGSGIFNGESEMGEADQITIPPNRSEKLYSMTLPFADYESECDEGTKTAYASVSLHLSISGDQLQRNVEILYSADTPEESCSVEFGGVENA